MITFHCWNPNFLHCSQFSNTSYTLQSEEHGFMKRTEVNSYYLNIPNPDRSLWTSRSCENYRKLEWNTSYLERNNVIYLKWICIFCNLLETCVLSSPLHVSSLGCSTPWGCCLCSQLPSMCHQHPDLIQIHRDHRRSKYFWEQ